MILYIDISTCDFNHYYNNFYIKFIVIFSRLNIKSLPFHQFYLIMDCEFSYEDTMPYRISEFCHKHYKGSSDPDVLTPHDV